MCQPALRFLRCPIKVHHRWTTLLSSSACLRPVREKMPIIFMENVLQQLVDQSSKSNQLLERQPLIIQQLLYAQSESLNHLLQHLESVCDLQLRIAELLDSKLHKLWDQPILFKADVMKKLDIRIGAIGGTLCSLWASLSQRHFTDALYCSFRDTGQLRTKPVAGEMD